MEPFVILVEDGGTQAVAAKVEAVTGLRPSVSPSPGWRGGRA